MLRDRNGRAGSRSCRQTPGISCRGTMTRGGVSAGRQAGDLSLWDTGQFPGRPRLPSGRGSGDHSASGRERSSRATGCPRSCVPQGENDCISVGASGHMAWGKRGRRPSLPGDVSTPHTPRPRRSRRSQRALDGAAGPGAYCFWLRWELREDKLQEAQRRVGATSSGVPDVFTLVGTWSPPALSQSIQGQGFRRRSQHPQFKRRPRQKPAGPGGHSNARRGGPCARRDGGNGMAAWPGQGAFPSLARCSQRAFVLPLCIL